MAYCGQEGFNFTEIEESDIDRGLEIANRRDATDLSPGTHPDDSLKGIADDYFGDE
jgi:hypothetical protein